MVITPITAKVHYDDLTKLWHLKAAREEASTPNDIKPYVELVGDFLNLVMLIQALLDWWTTIGSTINAEVGDLTVLASWANTRSGLFTSEPDDALAPTAEFPGPDFTDPPYDGTADSWGATA